jgi:beta-glucosidase
MKRHPLKSRLVTLLCTIFPAIAAAQAPAPDSAAVEQRVDGLLARLSAQQKVELVGGYENFYVRAIPEIGLPKLKMSDGPMGVRIDGPDTAYAAGIGLAAGWDPALAERTGASFGDDARARGVHFLLGPGLNLYRSPLNGRNMEYYGEDPYLAARTVVGFVEGLQSRGVSATVKHFAANNSEYDRRNLDTLVDERTLRELYLPAFEAAVKEAHTGAVMSSYNLLNGDYTAENHHLVSDILKNEWGFKGIFMSDWEAAYDGVKAANAGLDLEMPVGKAMSPDTLQAALNDGSLSMATLDDKVRRILRTAVRFDWLDRPQEDDSLPRYSQSGRATALETARESIVLLKNDNSTLPLDPKRLHTLAVIGPDAYPAVASGGGSSHVDAYAPVSILAGLSDALGEKVHVLYARGLPTADAVFKQGSFQIADGKPGLLHETFDNPDFQGTPSASETVEHVDSWKPELWTPSAAKHISMRWSGRYVPEKSGDYLFLTAAASFDTYKLVVDGKTVIEQPHREGQAPLYVTLPLTAGKPVTIELDYRPDVSYARMGLGVESIEDLIPPETRKIAAQADAAVVAVGFDPSTESEAFDRSFGLPWGQEALIRAVAAANPRTIVTVTSGGGYATDNWLGLVPALLQNWYPGQEGGTVLAEIVLGKRSPEGRLPISFERRWEDNPTHDWYEAPPHPEGQKPQVRYGEGVFLGYRWYTSHPDRAQPLFPFGYGLSYSHFGFGHLKLPRQASAGAGVDVSFDVTNTGKMAAAEVAQVYVGDPSASVPRPARELKGFRKLRLAPGQTQRVTLHLDRRAFAYYGVNNKDWTVDPGKFRIYVGESSAQTPLVADIDIAP